MSKKISDFFKTEPKVHLNCELNLESLSKSVEVKNEKQENFEIILNEIKSEPTEVQRVLQDINKEVQNGGFENLKTIKNEPKQSTKRRCKFCGLKVLKKSSANHIRVSHPEQSKNFKFICEFCSEAFQGVSNLKSHIALKHPETASAKKLFECDFDGKVFNSRRKILGHMYSHEKKVKCDLCQVEMRPILMRQHTVTVHIKERNFQCKICQYSFKSNSALINHNRIHNKKFQCQICSKMFPTLGLLNKHIKEYHENPKSFECKICGKKFNRKTILQNHQKVHDKNRPKPFKCQQCDYTTDNSRRLKNHQKYHEKLDKKFAAIKNPLKCQKCLAFCKNKDKLTKHMKSVHPEVPFQCDLCGKYMNIKKNLAVHIQGKTCQNRNV